MGTVSKKKSQDNKLRVGNQQDVELEEKIKALKESVYEFYCLKREECQKQYDLAESPDIGEIYDVIGDEKIKEMLFSKVAVMVITANKYEKNVLHTNISMVTGQRLKRMKIKLWPQDENSSETYAYYFQWRNYDILHIEAQTTGSYTIGGAADIVRYALENPYIYPSVIISLGICFGIDEDKQTMGDTIISEKMYPYFMAAKINEKGLFVSDDNRFRINSQLYSKIKSEAIDLNIFHGLGFDSYFGNYITGEAVVSNMVMRDLFVDVTTQAVLAGDMEGYGLFKECFCRSHKMPCLTIKSICDWGAVKNLAERDLFQQICEDSCVISDDELNSIKDRLQAYASYNAYQVLDKLLEKGLFTMSVFRIVEEKIKGCDENERIVHKEQIQKITDSAIQSVVGKRLSTSQFVEAIIENLVGEGVLVPKEKDAAGYGCFWTLNGGY